MGEVLRQVKLRSARREMVAWLDGRKRFKVGDAVTLRNHPEPDRLWSVVEIFGSMPKEQIRADWHVGGL